MLWKPQSTWYVQEFVKDSVEGVEVRGVNEPGTELTQKSGNGKFRERL